MVINNIWILWLVWLYKNLFIILGTIIVSTSRDWKIKHKYTIIYSVIKIKIGILFYMNCVVYFGRKKANK